jgi:hypothetical protein
MDPTYNKPGGASVTELGHNDREHQRRHPCDPRPLLPHGGEEAEFTSFRAGTSFLNLIARPRRKAGLGGRVTFCHSDADTLYAGVIAAGYRPNSAPRDDKWGERYFYLTTDPDGHQPSFASPLATY